MTSPPADRADIRPDNRADARLDEAAGLLADMRAGVEAAAGQIDDLAAELAASRDRVDYLETLVDLLLGEVDAPVVLIDEGRRITGLSRGSGSRLEPTAIGKPLSSVLPAPVVDELVRALDGAPASDADLPAAGDGAWVRPLPGGGAVLVLGAR